MPVPNPARSRAVLIGIGTYTHPDLPPLPAAVAGAAQLAALLRDPTVWGLSAGHVTVLGTDASAEQILGAVRDAAKQADDTLLVYFAGHGLRDHDDRLYLALAEADADHPQVGTLLYRTLRDVLRRTGHRARYRLTVLDCCYSGLAGSMSADAAPTRIDLAHALDEPPAEQADDTDDHGDVVLTSAPPTRRSFVPHGAAFPEFTGELISVLQHGIAEAGPALSVDEAWQSIRRRMRERNSPEPQQFAQNTVARQVRFHNRTGIRTPRPWRSSAEEVDRIASLKVAGGMVYARGLLKGGVRALDATTGAPRWTHKDGSGLNVSQLVVADGAICFKNDGGFIRALDAMTGATLWTTAITAPWHSGYFTRDIGGNIIDPVAQGDAVYFRTSDGSVHALDGATGSTRWTAAASSRPIRARVLTAKPVLPPVVAEQVAYFSRVDGSVQAVDAVTGTTRWNHPFQGWVAEPLCWANGILYVARSRRTYPEALCHALDPATGNTLWDFETLTPPVAAENVLYLSNGLYVHALDTATGTTRWKNYDSDGGQLIGPLLLADGILHVTREKGLHALDAATGATRWFNNHYRSHDYTVSGGTLYVVSGGQLHALDAATGIDRWTYDFGGGESTPLVVANGLAYIGTHKGSVHAVDAATGSGEP
jgi:outer membrane protein assembly factor BamB